MNKKSVWQNLIFIFFGLLCVVFWRLYQPEIISFWHPVAIPSTQNDGLPGIGYNAALPAEPAAKSPIDCGAGTAVKFDIAGTYEDSPELSCLGKSAFACHNAIGVLEDDSVFPNIVTINALQNSCNFTLSYPMDSALSDITGKKLAGQYISCPISLVKGIDNTNPASPKFVDPDKENPSTYASEIYLYGTLGLFVENNLDKHTIENLGCTGPYIDTLIKSYGVMEKKT